MHTQDTWHQSHSLRLSFKIALDDCYHPGHEHDHGVFKWEHFLRYWPFVWVTHRSLMNSPHKGQWHRALMFSLICAWTNGWVNNRKAGDFRRNRAHYDVIIMEGGDQSRCDYVTDLVFKQNLLVFFMCWSAMKKCKYENCSQESIFFRKDHVWWFNSHFHCYGVSFLNVLLFCIKSVCVYHWVIPMTASRNHSNLICNKCCFFKCPLVAKTRNNKCVNGLLSIISLLSYKYRFIRPLQWMYTIEKSVIHRHN